MRTQSKIESSCPPSVAPPSPPNPTEVKPSALTFHQKKTVEAIARGMKNRLIAKLLKVSVKTVEKHRQAAYDKIGVHCTADLVHWAMAAKLVTNKYEHD